MTRHSLAFLATIALAALSAPALAQDGPPPPPPGVPMPGPPPGWVDPQAPQYPAPYGLPGDPYHHGHSDRGPDHAGAPFVHPGPPESYPEGPAPYPPGPMAHGPMAWRGPAMAPGYGYGYGLQPGAVPAPCGCAASALPPVMWVPVPVETRYRYSAPVRRESVVVEEHVIRERVAERVPVHHETKYVKSAPPTKYTKSKVVKTTK